MKIFTSYFARMKKIPEDAIKISIALSTPANIAVDFRLLNFTPTWSILKEYKMTGDTQKYTERFYNEVLFGQDPVCAYRRLAEIFGGRDVYLLCYEKPTDFCHRHIVADWFKQAGFIVEEFIP